MNAGIFLRWLQFHKQNYSFNHANKCLQVVHMCLRIILCGEQKERNSSYGSFISIISLEAKPSQRAFIVSQFQVVLPVPLEQLLRNPESQPLIWHFISVWNLWTESKPKSMGSVQAQMPQLWELLLHWGCLVLTLRNPEISRNLKR